MNVRRSRQHQVHLWLSRSEYASLRQEAAARGETMSNVVRRLITTHQARATHSTSHPVVRAVSPTPRVHRKTQ
ncbi:MAG TPA: hypothetical protein VI485_32780 [Vicinamibacterales bacterium]|nr:hypothetical protein [Vicinamibacterales bacterium]